MTKVQPFIAHFFKSWCSPQWMEFSSRDRSTGFSQPSAPHNLTLPSCCSCHKTGGGRVSDPKISLRSDGQSGAKIR
eukprot:7631900-Pyramimonas_sp.AAC.1